MNPMTLRLETAKTAAREAGRHLLRRLGRLRQSDVHTKSRNNFVTAVDRQSENLIFSRIRRAHPQDAVLGEESGASGVGPIRWIVDPLDGTSNYIHQIPFFCVSIAVTVNDRVMAAVVYDPARDDLYSALRGRGAYWNDRPTRVSDRALSQSMVGNAIPYRTLHARFPLYNRIVSGVAQAQCDIRRSGSAALDLAFVSCGKLDGFWGFDQCAWDSSAGSLLVEEAGGKLCELGGGPWHLNSENFIAANPVILPKLRRIVRSALR